MLRRIAPAIPSSEITDEAVYLRRREFLRVAGGVALTAATAPWLGACSSERAASGAAASERETAGGALAAPETPLSYTPKVVTTDEDLNTFKEITSYNNFYEFGTGKEDPQRFAGRMTTSPWTVQIDGLCNKPADYHLEDLIKPYTLEERIYRLRCVERWSMVIPWIGVPLGEIIKRAEPSSQAAFVEFTTLLRPKEMPGQLDSSLDWPYTEGLRLDEAMHPLAILAVGLYGKTLMNQNGAPLRLVVPWKYGFKSIKSIVRIRFTEQQPKTAWNESSPGEYGFYSNVNPEVDHPRWSQSRERRIGTVIPRKTEMFNGYGEAVASLYTGMDLKKLY